MQRILTALILLPLTLAAVFWLPNLAFLVFLLAVMELAALELVRICRAWVPVGPLKALLVLVPAMVVLLAAALGDLPVPDLEEGTSLLLAASALTVLVGLVTLFGATPVERSLPALGSLGFGTLYLAVPAASVFRLREIDPWLVVLLVVMTAANDSLAYYVGSSLGRHKLSPLVSPNKTWEGAAAGLVGGLAATAAWGLWRLGAVPPELLLVAAATTIAAQCGDLMESMIKRGAGLKDSGRSLPGHGGVLDRLDGILFAAPVLLLGLGWIGLEAVAR
jgi:phosphatidate cytidylyltransferase